MAKQLTSPLHEARTNYKHYRNYSNCLLAKLLAQNSEGYNRVGIRLNTNSYSHSCLLNLLLQMERILNPVQDVLHLGGCYTYIGHRFSNY